MADNNKEYGLDLFSNHFNCAQSVLAPFADELGIEQDTALRLASSFGAGVSRQGEVCGAVSGALMVLGLRFGKDRKSGEDAKEACYEKTEEFLHLFKEETGSLLCRDLLKLDMEDPEVWSKASAEGKFESICPRMVEKAIGITEKILK